ncbi:MAG: hypothetical protein HC821_02570 [Lewinella sp.]|nr:hypothetical protein [Lewinella sp.]
MRTAPSPGTVENQSFPAGSLIISRGDNRKVANFSTTVVQLAAAHEAKIMAFTTGFSNSGFDLGSTAYSALPRPKVATIAGPALSNTEFGQLWYFFEQELNYPLSIYPIEDWTTALADHNTLILAEGQYPFSESQQQQLLQWVRGGGKLIAIGEATRALAEQPGFGLTPKSGKENENQDPTTDLLLPYGEAERRFISTYNPGAVFATELDLSHPLSFGLASPYASLKTNNLYYDYLNNGAWNVGRVRPGGHISGFVGKAAQLQFAESLTFGVEEIGRGQVIYLIDNPLFRGFWQNGKLLFSNALFQVH